MKLNLPSPLQPINISPAHDVFIKRDDLIHPWVSGNKYRKLKGFLENRNYQKVITFGGAFSNHLHATAAYCYYHNIRCVVYVRGKDADLGNPTLSDMLDWNAEIHFLDRSEYRNQKEGFEKEGALKEGVVFIPEGGWGEEGFTGMKQLTEELLQQVTKIDALVVPVGSGTTLIGLARHLPEFVQLYGIRAVKDHSLDKRINHHTQDLSISIQLIKGYEWKGFAKYDQQLIRYMEEKEKMWDLPLDFIYNAKAFFALEDLLTQGFFKEGSKIIYLHTGGLQGNRGLDYFVKKKPKG